MHTPPPAIGAGILTPVPHTTPPLNPAANVVENQTYKSQVVTTRMRHCPPFSVTPLQTPFSPKLISTSKNAGGPIHGLAPPHHLHICMPLTTFKTQHTNSRNHPQTINSLKASCRYHTVAKLSPPPQQPVRSAC